MGSFLNKRKSAKSCVSTLLTKWVAAILCHPDIFSFINIPLCILCNFCIFFSSTWNFSKLTFPKTSFKTTIRRQTILTNVMFCAQTVCKDHQQTTKFTASRQIVNVPLCIIHCSGGCLCMQKIVRE